MKSFEKIIKKLGDNLAGRIKTPIIVGGWAINLHGFPRQTIDFDFMIYEEEFDIISQALLKLGYYQTVKTELYARFESDSNDSYLYFDCLFADKNTYNKLSSYGKLIKIYNTEFILPCPMHIIAMKLHALKHGSHDREYKDFNDILSLIRIYDIDISNKSELEELCLKFGNRKLYTKIVESK